MLLLVGMAKEVDPIRTRGARGQGSENDRFSVVTWEFEMLMSYLRGDVLYEVLCSVPGRI